MELEFVTRFMALPDWHERAAASKCARTRNPRSVIERSRIPLNAFRSTGLARALTCSTWGAQMSPERI